MNRVFPIRLSILFLIFIFMNSVISGQENRSTANKNYKNDVSFNVTSLLGNLLSLNSNDTGVPYVISYRRHNEKLGFRISFAGDFNKSTDNFFFSNDTQSFLNLRLGVEKINQIAPKVVVTYGLDLLANYTYEESVLFTGNDFFKQIDEIRQLGIGPSIRLFYELNPRISFHTESSLYAYVGVDKTTYDSQFIQDEIKDTFSLKMAIPQALFITLSF